jgi:SAM-dependent methyltransferase
MTAIKSFIPQVWRSRLRLAYIGLGQWPGRFYCPVCERTVRAFAPLPSFYRDQFLQYGFDLPLEDAETCNFKAYTCPFCGASDRDRLYALYMGQRLGKALLDSFRLLDIGPGHALSQHIRRFYRLQYRTADLYMEGVDDRVDLTHMDHYPDASFDAFLCSHILEHIPDDRRALGELFRILKPGGWGIVMVPISHALEAIREDSSKTTEAERWRYFGQGDHVRIYNQEGFLNRLREAKFKTSTFGLDYFGQSTFNRCGIAEQSVLYVVEK